MASTLNPLRSAIEMARRGFHSVGVDVRRWQPADVAAPMGAGNIFKALVALREQLECRPESSDDLAFLEFCVANLSHSRAQLMQDLFVLYELKEKRGGYFVEFGATDGESINNTVVLEREYGWSGVLAEPAHYWHERLRANRRCNISTDCVWHTSGQALVFNETADKAYSTIDSMSATDAHASLRAGGQRYEVATVSLLDLLDRALAPRQIDYLSVDTEGSELDILRAFDFGRYDISVMTVEHNYTAQRAPVQQLLAANGFVRKFEAFSQWDDWYVRR